MICAALSCLLLSGQAPLPEPQRIVFPHENVSDLRGILNVFTAFRQACLEQPVTPDLAEKLAPEGYRVVTSSFHLWGTKDGDRSRTLVLSKTGDEERDFAGGYPIVTLSMPTDNRPDGDCKVYWRRAWDYGDDGAKTVVLHTGVMFNSWVSYYLKAILISRPDDGFVKAKRYGMVSDWLTPCMDGDTCHFGVIALADPEKGLDLTISRDGYLVDSIGQYYGK